MTQVGRTQFKSDTSTLYPDNTSGDISPADLRAQMENIADSSTFKGTAKITAPTSTDDDVGTNGNGTFDEGDIWVDETNDNVYICADSTTNTAIWLPIGGSLTVTKSGTAAVSEVALWLNDGEIIGDSEFTYASGNLTITSGTPIFELAESGAAVDNQRWRLTTTSEELLIQTLTDAGVAGSSYAAFTRTGDLLNAFEMYQAGAIRTSLTQNALNFTAAASSISTTDANPLTFAINAIDRVSLPSTSQDLIVAGNSSDGTATTRLFIGDASLTTGIARAALGESRAALGASHIDLITDNTTYTTYGFRTIRSAAVDGTTQMLHRGTGTLSITTEEAAPFTLSTNNTLALTVDTSQNITSTGNLDIAKSGPRINLIDTNTASFTITGATQDNPAVITVTDTTGLTAGDYVTISGVVGMTELNGNTYEISVVGATTFRLVGINSTGFAAYTSDGTADRVTVSFKASVIDPGVPITLVGNVSPHDLRLLTNDVARITIQPDGNVGIGTTDASLGLLVLNAESPNLIFNDISAGLVSEIVSGDTTLDIIIDAGNGVASSAITFNVDGTEIGRFDANGLRATKQVNAQTGTAYTPVLADDSARITMSNGSANTLTIPTNAAVAFPIGTELRIIQIAAGATSVAGDTGVTLNTVSAGLGAMAGAGQFTDIIKVATDEWWAVGDIGAVS